MCHAPCCCCLLELRKCKLTPNHRRVARGRARLLLRGWGWRVPRWTLVPRWWGLHGAARHVKEAGTGWVAAAASHHVWGSAHAILLLPAAAAACARWPTLLLWALIITVTAQESQVILILTLKQEKRCQHTAAERQVVIGYA